MKKYLSSRTQSSFIPILAVFALGLLSPDVMAKNGREFMLPNGTVNSCANCHINPGGGGERNAFGLAVFAAMGSIPRAANFDFWDAELAALDSDGDGFSNGTELGDPDGDFQNVGPTSDVSLPGDPNSMPPAANTAPGFTSSPVTIARIGEEYSYAAKGFDFEGQSLTFSKVSGPSWINVTTGGLVTGTPPVDAAGDHPISLRVSDNGSPVMSGTQNYTLTVSASFAGFQNLNFDLPGEAALAAADQDPDNDELPNIVEYALRTDPRVPDPLQVPGTPQFDGAGKMQFVLQVRDDDPSLMAQLETSDGLPFSSPSVIDPVESDPNGADGLKTWVFTDTISRDSIMSRYGRLKFQIPQ